MPNARGKGAIVVDRQRDHMKRWSKTEEKWQSKEGRYRQVNRQTDRQRNYEKESLKTEQGGK